MIKFEIFEQSFLLNSQKRNTKYIGLVRNLHVTSLNTIKPIYTKYLQFK